MVFIHFRELLVVGTVELAQAVAVAGGERRQDVTVVVPATAGKGVGQIWSITASLPLWEGGKGTYEVAVDSCRYGGERAAGAVYKDDGGGGAVRWAAAAWEADRSGAGGICGGGCEDGGSQGEEEREGHLGKWSVG